MDIDTSHIVGQHQGIHQWTVGQRCRLHSCLKPYFVAKKDVHKNIIYVASGHDHQALYSNQIFANNFNRLCSTNFKQLRCRFRFQHTKPLVDCFVQILNNDEVQIILDKPLRAITPGQYAVFYSDVACLGSARIVSSDMICKENRIHLNI